MGVGPAIYHLRPYPPETARVTWITDPSREQDSCDWNWENFSDSDDRFWQAIYTAQDRLLDSKTLRKGDHRTAAQNTIRQFVKEIWERDFVYSGMTHRALVSPHIVARAASRRCHSVRELDEKVGWWGMKDYGVELFESLETLDRDYDFDTGLRLVSQGDFRG